MSKILLVCMGNICRSPTAQGVLTVLAKREGLSARLQFDSAGTHGGHRGEPPDSRAIQAAARRGYDISKLRARSFRARDFADFDLLLAMDRNNLAVLLKACPDQHKPKLSLFLPYAGLTGPEEVPDPYFGGTDGFEKVLDICEEAGRRLIRLL